MTKEDEWWISLTRWLILLAFKATWFLARVTWWLGLFLIFSIAAAISGLVRIASKRAQSGDQAEISHYSEDGRRWWDHATGQCYPCSQTDRESCAVDAANAGTYWRKTALARLFRMGVIQRYRFLAVLDEDSQRAGTVVATSEFPLEARHGITLDHLDPARAADDQYNLGQLRDSARTGLEDLDRLLAAAGWERVGESGPPWYRIRYRGPAILWSEPLQTPVPDAPATA